MLVEKMYTKILSFIEYKYFQNLATIHETTASAAVVPRSIINLDHSIFSPLSRASLSSSSPDPKLLSFSYTVSVPPPALPCRSSTSPIPHSTPPPLTGDAAIAVPAPPRRAIASPLPPPHPTPLRSRYELVFIQRLLRSH
jgi:hypothetical protein